MFWFLLLSCTRYILLVLEQCDKTALCVFFSQSWQGGSIQSMPEHNYIFWGGCMKPLSNLSALCPPQPSVSLTRGLLDQALLCFFTFIFHQKLSLCVEQLLTFPTSSMGSIWNHAACRLLSVLPHSITQMGMKTICWKNTFQLKWSVKHRVLYDGGADTDTFQCKLTERGPKYCGPHCKTPQSMSNNRRF